MRDNEKCGVHDFLVNMMGEKFDGLKESIEKALVEMKEIATEQRKDFEQKFVRTHDRIDNLKDSTTKSLADLREELNSVRIRFNFYLGAGLVVVTLLQIIAGAVIVSTVRQGIAAYMGHLFGN